MKRTKVQDKYNILGSFSSVTVGVKQIVDPSNTKQLNCDNIFLPCKCTLLSVYGETAWFSWYLPSMIIIIIYGRKKTWWSLANYDNGNGSSRHRNRYGKDRIRRELKMSEFLKLLLSYSETSIVDTGLSDLKCLDAVQQWHSEIERRGGETSKSNLIIQSSHGKEDKRKKKGRL